MIQKFIKMQNEFSLLKPGCVTHVNRFFLLFSAVRKQDLLTTAEFCAAYILADLSFFLFFHFNQQLNAIKCFYSTPNRECFTEQSGKQLASCQHNDAYYKKYLFLCRRLLNFSIPFAGPHSLVRH